MPAFAPNRPYNTLPPLPPKADIESRAILRACIDVGKAVAVYQTRTTTRRKSHYATFSPVEKAREIANEWATTIATEQKKARRKLTGGLEL